jgi:hypothetical protein
MTPWNLSRKRGAAKNCGEARQSVSLNYTTLWHIVKLIFLPPQAARKDRLQLFYLDKI